MTEEGPLVDTGAGLVPQGEGWFVLNAGEAAWLRHDVFGARCTFEADGRIVNERPELHVRQHPQLGIRLHVLEPGKPSTMYHRESEQEGFLVLQGECVAIVEGQERRMRQWDYFHCPPGTAHITVGAGDGPCAILMAGVRRKGRPIHYPVDELAARAGASVAKPTDSPREAYADLSPGRARPLALAARADVSHPATARTVSTVSASAAVLSSR
jgi:uncharacterized cupin superfamily protein